MDANQDFDPVVGSVSNSNDENGPGSQNQSEELAVASTAIASGDTALNGNGSDIHGPGSSCGSHTHPETSTAPSQTCLSLEERLRRMRAAEELKQQQRYAAYLESQRQAELSRLKAQEDRKRKLEELHQRAEARRQLVLERRRELELSNRAKLEMLRDRSSTRYLERRRHTDLPVGFGRTASASASLDSARNPSRLMTTSCVVAFGSSAPRSLCTQLSPAALRLQQAFEARIASYLTGRHSGCYLTPSASPQLLRLIPSERLSLTPSAIAFSQRHITKSKRCHRRAVSAHASLLQHTKASLARTKHAAEPDVANIPANVHSEAGSRSAKHVTLAVVTNPISSSASDEVTYDRSNSSHDCHTLGRPRAPISTVSSARFFKPSTNATAVGASSAPHSVATSAASSSAGSHRSNSVDSLAKRSQSTHVPSVFERLAGSGSNRNRSATTSSDVKPKSAVSTMTVKKLPPNGPMPPTKRPLVPASRTLTKGMSASVYVDRPNRKVSATKNPSAAPRKRSASPKSSSAVQPFEPASTGASSDSLALPKQNEVPLPNSDAAVMEPTSVTEVKCPDINAIDIGISPASEFDVPPGDALASPKHSDTVVAVESEASPDLPKQLFEPNADDVCTLTHSAPLKAETKGAGEGALLNENEAAIYRAKLFEQRRLAKERKEQEQRRLEEEQRRRKSQEEAERLATEQAALEQAERLAQEEAEARRLRDEEEKARLRAAEAERLAKLQRAEEERIMRKKRLDSIMSRVKLPTTNGKASDPLPTNLSSTPLSQGCENGESNTAAVISGDTSYPVLPHHSVTASQDFGLSVGALPLQSHGSVGGTEDQRIPSTEEEKRNESPVMFSLLMEQNGLPNGHGEFSSIDPRPDFADCNGTGAGFTSIGNPSLHAFHQPSPIRPTSVPSSPAKSALSLSANPNASSTVDGNATAPLFKSALLQSMLSGGRLATRVKDAVIGLRSRGSSTQLLDFGSRTTDDESGANSPRQWAELTPSGDHTMEGDGSSSLAGPMSCGRQADLNRSSPMVQSMFEGPVDNFRLNCSNEAPRSVGSPSLPLAQHQD